MGAVRLLFAESAARDLKAIVDYIDLDDAEAAQRVYRSLVAAAERLRLFPKMGRPGRLAGTRELVVPRLPYRIVYEVRTDHLLIVAVFHTARHLARALSDRKARL